MNQFKKEILEFLSQHTKESINLEIPPKPELGDYAFPCFSLSKHLKKKPNEIAQDLASQFTPTPNIQKAQAFGPYVNFFVDQAQFTKVVIQEILQQKNNYGSQKKKKQSIMVEFSHYNTHKGVHIGHVRNTSLGSALSRILEKVGYAVVRVNYQGDIGPHVAKCLWAYQHTDQKPPKQRREEWLGQLYAKANQQEKEDNKVKEEIKEVNRKLYAQDPELTKLWKETRQWCLNDFEKIYKAFGVKYDRYYFESEVLDQSITLAKELIDKGIAKKSEGAYIVDLEKDKLGIYVLLTKDGHAVYQTKDLGLAEQKVKEYPNIIKSIHVVGKEQELFFKQVFKTLELMNSPIAPKSHHLMYELVMLPEGKMSSREGNVILYNALLDKLRESALEQVQKRHSDWNEEQIHTSTEAIAFSALKFGMLHKENNRRILFDWSKATDFEGDTGPYVQYAHARICSLFRKHNQPLENPDLSLLTDPKEQEIIKKLGTYPDVVQKVGEEYKLHLLCHYALDLARSFNEFYHACPMLQAEPKLRDARLSLCQAVQHVLADSLELLGIVAPEQM